MANKRGRTVRLEIPPDESQSVSQAETEASEEVEQIASEFGSGSFAIIQRLNPRTAQYAFLDRIPGTEINQAILAERYGGGSYRVQFRGPKAGKRNVILDTRNFEVDASIPPKTPPGFAFASTRTGPLQPDESNDVTMDKIMQAGVLRLFSAYEQVLDRKEGESNGKGDETMQLIVTMMQSNTQMMMAMMNSQSQQAQAQAQSMMTLFTTLLANKPELQEQLALAKALNGGDSKQSFKEMLESFQMLREIAGDVAPPMEGWPGLVREFVPPVLDALSTAKQNDAMRASVPQPRPQTPPAAINPPQPQEPNVLWQMAVRAQLPFLLKQARAGKDPEFYAAFIFDQVPDAYLGDLRVLCGRDTFVSDTLAAFPDTQPHREWFNTMLSSFRDIVINPDPEDGSEVDDILDEPEAAESQPQSEATPQE